MEYERIPTFYITFINCDDMGEHTLSMEMQAGSTADDARVYVIESQKPGTRILIVSVWDADFIDDLYNLRSPKIPAEIVRYLGWPDADDPLDFLDGYEPEGEPYTESDNDPANWGVFRDDEEEGDDEEGEEWKKLL